MPIHSQRLARGLHFNDRRLWRVVFVIAFVLRAICAVQLSYLHPDEHLQGPQVIAHGWFGWAAEAPWEFTDPKPLRSFVPLWFVYGIPMTLFGDSATTSPLYVLYTLRILLAVFTWILEDMAVDRLSSNANDKLRSLLFVSTSYVTWTWQSHTLSNSLETVLVLWYLVILHEFQRGDVVDRHYDGFLLGCLTAFAVFNRPSFIAFILIPSITMIRFFLDNKLVTITFLAGALLTAGACIAIDTTLYGSQDWVIAPLNHIRYNRQVENLAEHGLHPLWTHLVVNVPQLIGPGLLLLRPQWTSLPMQSIISALAVLSTVSHQEARFLLPLVPLLATQMDLTQFKPKFRGLLLGLWFAFNLFAAFVIGFMHQSGVVPAQVQLREIAQLPCTVLWWRTYTPPLWMSGLHDSEVRYAELSDRGEDFEGLLSFIESPPTQTMTVIDLLGASPDVFNAALDAALDAARSSNQALYVVTPLTGADALVSEAFAQEPIWKYGLHLATDHIDWSNFKLGLGIYEVPQTAAIQKEIL